MNKTWQTELRAIFARSRNVTAADIVAWAQVHPRSLLHGQFEWDDAAAAATARETRARELIRSVRIVHSPSEANLPMAVRVSSTETYVSTEYALEHDEEALRAEEARILLGHLRRYAAWPWRHAAWVALAIADLEHEAAQVAAEEVA